MKTTSTPSDNQVNNSYLPLAILAGRTAKKESANTSIFRYCKIKWTAKALLLAMLLLVTAVAQWTTITWTGGCLL